MNDMVPAGEPSSLLNIIERASRDQSVDVAKLQALLDMQERVLLAEAKHAFNDAMALMAHAIEPVKRNAQNPQYNSYYATLSALDAAIRPHYTTHGFSVRFLSEDAPGAVRVTCIVARGKYDERQTLTAPVDRGARNPVQAIGSTVSYLRRYLLGNAFNITFADNDGQGGGKPPPAVKTPDQLRPERVAEWMSAREIDLSACQTQEDIDAVLRANAKAAARLTQQERTQYADLVQRNRQRILDAVPALDEPPLDDTAGPAALVLVSLIEQVGRMVVQELDRLPTNAAWRLKVSELEPWDQEALEAAIAARRETLARNT